jgi:hypothetical protein
MQEDFFVGFDNDMDDFQNIVGKIKQRRADIKEATGSKTNIGSGIKRLIKPLSTQKNLKQIRDTRKAGAMTPEMPTDVPIEVPIEETMAGGMASDMVADMGSVSGETKSASGGLAGLSTGAKIGIGVGALVVVGTIIFFVARKK